MANFKFYGKNFFNLDQFVEGEIITLTKTTRRPDGIEEKHTLAQVQILTTTGKVVKSPVFKSVADAEEFLVEIGVKDVPRSEKKEIKEEAPKTQKSNDSKRSTTTGTAKKRSLEIKTGDTPTKGDDT
jgi:hypothetical protein